MAKFAFRLQSYLNLKEKLEEQKKLEYGKALAKLEEERKLKVSMENEKEETIASFKKGVSGAINSMEIQSFNNHIELLKRQIKQQEKVIAAAEKFVDTKRQELVEAVKNRKMLEKLKEKAKDEYIIEEKLGEQKIVDEVTSYRYSKI